jgi:hypothetical protein
VLAVATKRAATKMARRAIEGRRDRKGDRKRSRPSFLVSGGGKLREQQDVGHETMTKEGN